MQIAQVNKISHKNIVFLDRAIPDTLPYYRFLNLLLPLFGITGNYSFLIFIMAMFACHLLMPMHHGSHEHDTLREYSETSKKDNHESHQHQKIRFGIRFNGCIAIFWLCSGDAHIRSQQYSKIFQQPASQLGCIINHQNGYTACESINRPCANFHYQLADRYLHCRYLQCFFQQKIYKISVNL